MVQMHPTYLFQESLSELVIEPEICTLISVKNHLEFNVLKVNCFYRFDFYQLFFLVDCVGHPMFWSNIVIAR